MVSSAIWCSGGYPRPGRPHLSQVGPIVGGVTHEPTTEFLNGLTPSVRDTAARLIQIASSHAAFDVAIKWRQLTFAVDGDFDHWVCAVAATSRQARLAFHFGAWLEDRAEVFDPSDAQFVRKISYRCADDVDEDAVRGLLAQAIEALPRFRATRRGPARPTRPPS